MYGDSLGARITQLWLNVYGKMAKATWASGEGIPGIHLNGRTIIYYFCLRNYSEISVYQIIYHAWIVNSNYILCYISQSKTSCCLPGPNKTSKRPMFNMIHFVITWWPFIPARTMFFFSRRGKDHFVGNGSGNLFPPVCYGKLLHSFSDASCIFAVFPG